MATSKPRERTIEAYLRKRVRETGGECYKFVSPGRRGVPDRMCVWLDENDDHPDIIFVEVKRPGGKTTSQQNREIQRMVCLGLNVETVKTKYEVDWLVSFHA